MARGAGLLLAEGIRLLELRSVLHKLIGRRLRLVVFAGQLVRRDIVAREQQLHLALQAALERRAIGLRACRHHADGHSRIGQLDHALVERAVQDLGHALGHLRQLTRKHVLHVRQALARGNDHIDVGIGVELGLVHHVGYAAVAQDQHIPGPVLDLRGAHADLHDGAGAATHLDDVANAELALEDDEQTAQDIGDKVLRAERQRQGDDAHGSQKRCGVDAQHAKAPIQHEHDHAVLHHA